MRSGWGILKPRGVVVCTPRQQGQVQHQLQREVEEKADVVYMSAHFAISRTAASRVNPIWGLFGKVKLHSIMAARILLLENQQWQETSVG